MFLPHQHTAAEVLDYLTTVAADTVEVGRVLACERIGLARPEILAAFTAAEGGRPQLEGEP